jgi:sulfur carrier protein ThiS
LKIIVESLGLPTLSGIIGKKAEIELPDGTVADLINHIGKRYGPKAKQHLLDGSGELDLTIQVMVNDEGFVPREEFSQRSLKDGDQVKFLLIAGGG